MVGRADTRRLGIVGRALAEAAVGTVRVVVLDILGDELCELSAVPDQGAVAQFAAYGADPTLRVRVRDRRVRRGANDRRAIAAEDLIECTDELAGASRITKRIIRSARIMKFRAAWVVHAPVGLVVIPARCTRRRSSSMKNST
jgi:hypothetical protein